MVSRLRTGLPTKWGSMLSLNLSLFSPNNPDCFCGHQPTVQMTVCVKSWISASEHPDVLKNKLEEDVEINFCSSTCRGV